MWFLGSKSIDRLGSPLWAHSQKQNFPINHGTIKMDGLYFCTLLLSPSMSW